MAASIPGRSTGVAAAVVVALWLSAGCAQLLGIEEIEPNEGAGGTASSCTGSDPGECADDNPCTDDSCEPSTSRCVHAPRDTPAPPDQQAEGDCKEIRCNAGVADIVAAPEDRPDDQNQCTENLCEGTTPHSPPLPAGHECTDNGGQECDGAGDCKRHGGQPCDSADQCLSGHCPVADSVCCNEPCDGACMACVESKTIEAPTGTCAQLPPGADPDDECGAGVCNFDGACTAECGANGLAPGGICPSVCTGDCGTGNSCVIDCDTSQACMDQTIDCPEGFECLVRCVADQACLSATINCQPDYPCYAICDGTQACDSAVFNCSAWGNCKMNCGTTDDCDGAAINCGLDLCWAECDGTITPSVHCGPSCGCIEC